MRQSRRPCVVYVAVEEGGPSKIGVAVVPERRVRIVGKQCERPVRLVWSKPHADCMRVETLACRILAKHRHKEFRVEGNCEWFDVPPERVIAAAAQAIHILETDNRAAMKKWKCPPEWRRRRAA